MGWRRHAWAGVGVARLRTGDGAGGDAGELQLITVKNHNFRQL